MFTECLIYFPRCELWPDMYATCKPVDAPAMLKMGGLDVSSNSAHWREWDRQESLAARRGSTGCHWED